MSSRKFLVTGGAGFIGSHISEALVRHGDQVRILDNLSTGRTSNLAGFADEVELIEGSILDEATLAKAVDGVEVIYHQAAYPSVPASLADPTGTHAVNTTGTLNLLEAAVKAGVRRVVYAASSSAYGDQPAAVKSEDMEPRPLSPYAVQKLTAEHYMKAYAYLHDIEAVCLRYFNIFGPRQSEKSQYAAVVPAFISRMLRGEPAYVHGDGLQSRDFTFVANAVAANLSAADAPEASGETINVACGASFTLLDLVEIINDLLGAEIAPEHGPAREGDVRHSLADISKAKRLLGYSPDVSFREGVERTLESFRALNNA